MVTLASISELNWLKQGKELKLLIKSCVQFGAPQILFRTIVEIMEVETNDCVEKENPQEMDEDVFKEHVKLLKWKYGKTVREIEKYTVNTIHRSAKEIDQEKREETYVPKVLYSEGPMFRTICFWNSIEALQ